MCNKYRVQVPPDFGQVMQHYHRGQWDPVYAVVSRFVAGGIYRATDLGIDYEGDDGEGYFMDVSADEIEAVLYVCEQILQGDYTFDNDYEAHQHWSVASVVYEWWPDINDDDDEE